MGNIECLVGWMELLVYFLGGSVLTDDMAGAANKILVTSGYGLKIMLVGSLYVSGPCTLQLSYGTQYKIS